MIKHFLRHSLSFILGLLSGAVVRKYKPKVVMVTGSVGKTSTKDAVAALLAPHTFIRASEKSYNSEFGVPLTICGVKNPWLSALGWLGVLKEAFSLLFFPAHYPKVLVLEVGADRPGDLLHILRFITPHAVVVTRLPDIPVHVEAYVSAQAVRDEEFAPADALPPGGVLVLCADDEHALAMAKRLSVPITTFGFSEIADVRILESTSFTEGGRTLGTKGRIRTGEVEHEVVVQGALGRTQLLAPSAALALMRALGYESTDALSGISDYVSPPGRGRIIQGICGSTLIDDSYNASPVAVQESLTALCMVKEARRRIAVLGDMLELGRYSVSEHERIGTLAASCVDVVIAIGVRARSIASAAKAAGLPEASVFSYHTADEAAAELKTRVEEGDVILIKGSQSIRTERVVRELLRDPGDADTLVRQDSEWRKR